MLYLSLASSHYIQRDRQTVTFIIIDHLDVVSLPGLLSQQHDGDAREEARQQTVQEAWTLTKMNEWLIFKQQIHKVQKK